MIITKCLILESKDYTSPDQNLRKEAFEALIVSPIVIEGARVIKCEVASAPVVPVVPPKRSYVKKVPQTTPDAPQAPTAPIFTPDSPPSFDDISSES